MTTCTTPSSSLMLADSKHVVVAAVAAEAAEGKEGVVEGATAIATALPNPKKGKAALPLNRTEIDRTETPLKPFETDFRHHAVRSVRIA
ncbi:Uncharacterized protein TCM_028739 [Theobroma cacao]|uniref:Uncharacterized protein n=1 Tax=Theobroma cacao TaxID=3641 RepID=A0A061GA96_THECC|nr:Uncharacterized protein TCM_028739 [Theobroma cacao]